MVRNIRDLMVSLGIHHAIDDISISMLARLVNRLNSLPDLGLDPEQEIDVEMRIMNAVNKHLAALGLTKSKQMELQSSLRGRGRPSKAHKIEDDQSANWEGILDD